MMLRTTTMALVLMASIGSIAMAQDETVTEVTDRLALPADGSPLDLEPMLGPTRTAVLQGTFSNAHDGSEIDPFARRSESARFQADGPFVLVPPETEVLEEDLAGHRYVLRFPEGARATIAFAIGRLAGQQLQTRTEAANLLTGRIEVLVHGVPLAPVVAVDPVPADIVAPVPEESNGWLWGLLGLIPIGGGLLLWRSRRDEWKEWLARAAAAVKNIEREGARLGPAFDDAVAASRDLHERAVKMRQHAVEVAAARARITGSSGEAAAKKEQLAAQLKSLEVNMEALVGRLEGVAAQMSAQVADQTKVDDLDSTLAAVGRELDIALAADREATRQPAS